MAQTPAAFEKLKSILHDGGLDEESIAFIVNKYTHAVTDQVMAEVVKVVGEGAVGQLTSDGQAEQLAQLEATFKEKKGTSIAEYKEEVAKQLVAELEAA